MEKQILTVSQVNYIARVALEEITVWVEGEVDDYEPNYKSAVYLKLKDSDSVLPAMYWKNTDVSYHPKNGDKVRVFGTLTIYEKVGKYQMLISKIEEAGVGDLLKKREELRRRLQAEGYFDEVIKRSIPGLPLRIGLVTSKRGAAIKDFLTNLTATYEGFEIYFVDSLVQGDAAVKSMCRALETLSKIDLDIIVLTRGGGDLEDLMCFNTEELVKSIRACPFPVISAVGHEIDYTLSDLASDLRVSTPTKAAEFLSLKFVNFTNELRNEAERMKLVYQRLENSFKQDLDLYESTLRRSFDALKNLDNELGTLKRLLGSTLGNISDRYSLILRSFSENLEALSPKRVLGRGYSIVFSHNKKVVRSAKKLSISDQVCVKLADGSFDAGVLRISHDR